MPVLSRQKAERHSDHLRCLYWSSHHISLHCSVSSGILPPGQWSRQKRSPCETVRVAAKPPCRSGLSTGARAITPERGNPCLTGVLANSARPDCPLGPGLHHTLGLVSERRLRFDVLRERRECQVILDGAQRHPP